MALHRKIRKSGASFYRRTLGPSVLYLDDVVDIQEALIDAAKERSQEPDFDEADLKVTVTAGIAEADNIEDLREATREEIEELSLSLRNPRINVDLWWRGAEVSADAADDDGRVLADEIAEFFAKRGGWTSAIRTMNRAFLSTGIFLVGAGVACAAVGLTRIDQGHHDVLGITLLCAGAAAAILLPAVSLYVARRNNSVRVLQERRSESRGISQGTRHDIAIALIGAVSSAVILGLAGLWAGVFASK